MSYKAMKINKVSKIYTQKYKEGVQESPYLTMYQDDREEREETRNPSFLVETQLAPKLDWLVLLESL